MNSRENPKRRRIGSPSLQRSAYPEAEPLQLTYSDRTANFFRGFGEFSAQHTLYHDSIVCCVRFSWDGGYLATGGAGTAHMYDAQTGQKIATFSKVTALLDNSSTSSICYARSLCFSPDNKLLITGNEDHVVKVWDVKNRVLIRKLVGHTAGVFSVDASENGSFVISGSGDSKAKVWSLQTGILLNILASGHNGGITSVSVSPTSQHVAAASLDGIIRVWDVESTRIVREFQRHKDAVHSIKFSPDGRMLLSGSFDTTVKLWDLAASHSPNAYGISFTGHKDFVLSVAFSRDGRLVLSGSRDRSVRIWDSRKPSLLSALQGHTNSVISIEHDPVCERFATGSGDFLARTWSYCS